ncbi:hypothetical protein KAR91_10290 [Candidatus Pacearchaeota archaeon]|nr:hypothetical protein [Candidatus Pacearchaeota archaeon]
MTTYTKFNERQKGKILDLLHQRKIFSIDRTEENHFCFREMCDEYFYQELDIAEMNLLIVELQEAVRGATNEKV